MHKEPFFIISFFRFDIFFWSFFPLYAAPERKRNGEAIFCAEPRRRRISTSIGASPYYMLPSRIGHHLGFQDDSYFVKYFKKQTSISPLDFRKQSSRRWGNMMIPLISALFKHRLHAKWSAWIYPSIFPYDAAWAIFHFLGQLYFIHISWQVQESCDASLVIEFFIFKRQVNFGNSLWDASQLSLAVFSILNFFIFSLLSWADAFIQGRLLYCAGFSCEFYTAKLADYCSCWML